jgi:enoyl-CoA hydratase/carnithine racemase
VRDDLVLMERAAGSGVATLTLNQPETGNALTSALLAALRERLTQIGEDETVRAAVLTGAGGVFAVHADLTALAAMERVEAVDFAQSGQAVLRLVETTDAVFIAAIEGSALGAGFDLALACDLRVAAEDAEVGLPELRLGFHPAFGATQRLARLVGLARAKELILTGAVLTGREAAQMGLVNRAVPAAEVAATAAHLAAEIAARPRVALRMAKHVLNHGALADLDTGLLLEAEHFGQSIGDGEAQAALGSYLKERRSTW